MPKGIQIKGNLSEVKESSPFLSAMGTFFSEGVGDEWTLLIIALFAALAFDWFTKDATAGLSKLVIGGILVYVKGDK